MAANTRGKKRVSRHKKKHWRKYTDIQDVEEHLEVQRFEERTGGLVATRPNEMLFFQDKDKPPTKEEKKKLNSFTQRQQMKKKAGLTCHQLLEPAPYPKAITIPKQQKRLKKLHPVRQKQVNRKLKKWLEAAPPLPRPAVGEVVPHAWIAEEDVWDNDSVSVRKEPLVKKKSANELAVSDDYYTEIDDFYKQQTKQKPVKVPEVRYVKPSALPSVEVPLPGASYNPAFDDYEELLVKAAAVEVKKQKAEEHLNRVLIQKFPTKAEAPTQESWLLEMSQGLYKEPKTSEDEDDSQDVITGNPATRCERKLRSKRRREEKEKMQLEMNSEEKLQRKRESDIYRIKKLKSEIQAAEALSEERQNQRITRKDAKRFLPAKLSQHKYEAPDIEVHLPTELSGSLRLMKPEGCLLEDRLKSFQRRNIIEPRVRQNVKRKYKLKRYTRKSHKESAL